MKLSATLPLVPETARVVDSGAGACAVPSLEPRDRMVSASSQALHRAVTSDAESWLRHVEAAAGCSHPIQLSGVMTSVDGSTGEVVASRSTSDMPDGVIYKACGNRRVSVCPSCAEVYRRDAFELIRTGLIGGKTIPSSVSKHPAVFATFTAPGFGAVHTRRTSKTGQVVPCRPRRKPEPCPHGVDLRCSRLHSDDERSLGTPLCLDCYDYDGQVVWNNASGELWRRTRINIDRALARICRQAGLDTKCFKTKYIKVAEFQVRGVVHFHAIIRLDGAVPKELADPGLILAPPAGLGVDELAQAVETAARGTSFTTVAHPVKPEGWSIGWGKVGLDIRPITLTGDDDLSDSKVAGYLAKYATKDTEATGHTSRKLTTETVEFFADPDGDHVQRLIAACWYLGSVPEWVSLRRWAHRLGFAGHPYTKARTYSVTFGQLRDIRTQWRRAQVRDLAAEAQDETIVLVNYLTYSTSGWRTEGDALLAATAADQARQRNATARDEIAHQLATTGSIQ